jgi:hypothetical protein
MKNTFVQVMPLSPHTMGYYPCSYIVWVVTTMFYVRNLWENVNKAFGIIASKPSLRHKYLVGIISCSILLKKKLGYHILP